MSNHIRSGSDVTHWYVAELQAEDPEAGERAVQILAAGVARSRVQMGLVPHPGGQQPASRAPCGCERPDVVVESDGVEWCRTCSGGAG